MRNTKRSPCPISCTLDIVGDRWTMLVVRDLFAGKSHYNEFSKSPERISTNILADRLEKLEVAALIERFPSEKFSGKYAYRLTPKGQSLYPVMDAMVQWGLDNIKGTKAFMKVKNPLD